MEKMMRRWYPPVNGKMAIVKGIGPNDIEIIGMVFSNYQNALDFAVSVLGTPGSQGIQNGNRVAGWVVDFEDDDGELAAMKFFTGYYGGCGECEHIEVVEIDAGVPLVAFNLD